MTTEVELWGYSGNRRYAPTINRRVLRVCDGCCVTKVYETTWHLGFIQGTTHRCQNCGARMRYMAHVETDR